MKDRLVESTGQAIVSLKPSSEPALPDFRFIVENLRSAILFFDLDRKLQYGNQAVEVLTGYSPKELSERFDELVDINDCQNPNLQLTDVFDDNTECEFECRVISKDNKVKWLQARYQPLYDKTGREIGTCLSLGDITKRKKAERNIEFNLELDRTISIISSRFIHSSDVDDSINASLEDIGMISKAERVCVFLINHDAGTISETHEWCALGVSPQIDTTKDIPVDTLPWLMNKLHNGEIVHITDISALPEEAITEKKFFMDRDIKSTLAFPLRFGKELAGFIGFFNTTEIKKWNEADLSLLGVSSGVLGSVLENKRAKEALQESEEKFRAISDSAQDAIIMADNDGRITLWNVAAVKMFGYSDAEAIGKETHRFLAPERYYAAAQKGLTEFRKSGTGNAVGKIVELKAVRKSGEEFPIELSLSSMRLKGQWHAVAVIRDVTEQQKSRQQLMQSDKLAAIGTLAAGVAHEINNPTGFVNSNLNTMKKYLKRIERYIEQTSNNDEERFQDIKEIITDFGDAVDESIEGTTRVKDIVADLKNFSRVDRAEKEYADINDRIKSALNMVWNELKYKAKVETDFADLPDLFCMPNQLNQVFMNLLVNAGHTIEGKEGLIKIKTWADGKNIYVSIKDNGCGMSQETLNRIFEPFFTTKDVGKGTGLGLSLVHDIVKKHKGKIETKSEIGVGTEFIIELPLEGIDGK